MLPRAPESADLLARRTVGAAEEDVVTALLRQQTRHRSRVHISAPARAAERVYGPLRPDWQPLPAFDRTMSAAELERLFSQPSSPALVYVCVIAVIVTPHPSGGVQITVEVRDGLFCGNDGINHTDYLGNLSLGDFLNPFSKKNPLNPFGNTSRKIANWSQAHSLGATLLGSPFALLGQARDTWHFAQQNPQVAAVIAAIVSWYVGGTLALAIEPELTATETTVIAGASAGFGGGFVGARASGASIGQSFVAAAEGAAIGAATAYAGSAWLHANPPVKFSVQNAVQAFETSEIRYEIGRFAQNKLGLNQWAFEGILEAASFAGEYLVGDPNKQVYDNNGHQGLAGFFDRNPSSGLLFPHGGPAHMIAEFPFDVNDTLLAYQGLPDAVDLRLMAANIRPPFGHSLGALRYANLTAWGFTSGGAAYALPFGMIAPSGVSVYIGPSDPITAWFGNLLFNPEATVLPTGHSMEGYRAALGN